jgi:hypothetical protein
VVVALTHPTSFQGDDTAVWLAVHVAQFALAPLIALGLLGLLRGIEGPPGVIARGGALLWAVWFAVYDGIAGIGTGILATADMTDAATHLMNAPLVGVFGAGAPILWLVTAVSGVFALQGAPRPAQVAMWVTPLIAVHAGLPAAIGYAALAVVFWTGRRPARRLI